MRPLADVHAEILGAVSLMPTRSVAPGAALGLVLAAPVVARHDVPPFANSAMDGYALRAPDTAHATDAVPTELRVVGEVAAGHAADGPVGEGEAMRIMTGAPVPAGADAVVMVEYTEARPGGRVAVRRPARVGDHVRAAAGDVPAGSEVFAERTVLGPAHLGVLASIGHERVEVFARPRVGVLSTGDELRDGSMRLLPGQIRDSNRPMLLALLAASGMEPVDLGIARDDEALITRRLERAIAECDAVITSGGVSVGDYDFVKAALDRLGSLTWSQVAIRPAKPLAFGVIDGTPVFGLPGNPVSSHVSFELFARPALRKMAGHTVLARPMVDAVVVDGLPRRADGRLHLDRVQVRYEDGAYRAGRSGAQASNALAAMASANGLAFVEDGDGVPAGGRVRVLLLDA